MLEIAKSIKNCAFIKPAFRFEIVDNLYLFSSSKEENFEKFYEFNGKKHLIEDHRFSTRTLQRRRLEI